MRQFDLNITEVVPIAGMLLRIRGTQANTNEEIEFTIRTDQVPAIVGAMDEPKRKAASDAQRKTPRE